MTMVSTTFMLGLAVGLADGTGANNISNVAEANDYVGPQAWGP